MWMNTPSLHELAPEFRPRERLLKHGPQQLSDQDLMAIVLGSGTKSKNVLTLAQEVILYLKSTPKTPDWNEIAAIHGIGKAKACQIGAIVELSRRFLMPKARVSIVKPTDALPYLHELRVCRQEKVAVLTLDGHHQVIQTHVVTVGLANQSQIHPRETFHPAIRDQAVGILVAHNHPSGHLLPSEADLSATRRLNAASRVLGIPMLDHLIVAETGIYSIREHYPECFSAND
jgi:DNA repair protein RadC